MLSSHSKQEADTRLRYLRCNLIVMSDFTIYNYFLLLFDVHPFLAFSSLCLRPSPLRAWKIQTGSWWLGSWWQHTPGPEFSQLANLYLWPMGETCRLFGWNCKGTPHMFTGKVPLLSIEMLSTGSPKPTENTRRSETMDQLFGMLGGSVYRFVPISGTRKSIWCIYFWCV